MIKRLFAATLLSLFTIGNVYADRPEAGDIAVFVTDPFNTNQLGGLNVSTTSYNIGGFILDDLMVYGGLRGLRASGDNYYAFNVGSRFYLDIFDSPIRTFVDGNLSYASEDVDGLDAEIITLGGFAGAELFLAPRASLAIRVGVTASKVDVEAGTAMDNDTNVFNIGATDVVLNVYF